MPILGRIRVLWLQVDAARLEAQHELAGLFRGEYELANSIMAMSR